MTFSVILITCLFYLIPGMTEKLSHYNKYVVSTGLACEYLDIQYKRNIVYITAVSSIFVSFTKMYILRYFLYSLFLFSNYSYFTTIKRWHFETNLNYKLK